MTEFEKNARQRLQEHPSPLETDRLWANIERELAEDKRRPKLLWFWLLSLGLLLVSGTVWFTGYGSKAKAPAPNPAPPANQRPTAASGTKSQLNTPIPKTTYAPSPTRQQAGTSSSFQVATLRSDGQPANTKPTQFTNVATKRTNAGLPASALEQGPEAAPAVETPGEVLRSTDKWEALLLLPVRTGSLRAAAPVLSAHAGEWNPDCPSWRKRVFHPYFGLYGGAQYPLKFLESKTQEFRDLAQQRNATETVLEGWAVGAYLGLRHRSGFMAEGGLEYNRINERFDLKTVLTDTIGRIGITGIIVNAPGDTTFIQDSIFVVEETRTVKQTYNHYHFLQIPVALGFEWPQNERWTIFVKAGVAFNILFRQKAEMLNPSGVPEKYTSDNRRSDYPFRSGISLTPFANVGARYRLLNGLSVFGELRYLRQGSNVTTNAYPLRQRYALPGANVGLHVQF